MNRRNVLFVLVTVLGIIADQATKAWIVANVELYVGRIVIIPGFLDIVHAQNPGAAFGMLGTFQYRHVLFLIFTVIAGLVIFDLFRKLPANDWFMSTALGLILSGAVGNAIDRARQQYVTDFIRVYTENEAVIDLLQGVSEWPAFNVADSNLVVGVGMLIIHYLWFDDSRKPAEEEPTADEP